MLAQFVGWQFISLIFFNSLSPKNHPVKLVSVLQQRCWKFCPLTYLLCVQLPITWLSDSPDLSCSLLLVIISPPCRQIHILNNRLIYIKSAATDHMRNNSNQIELKKIEFVKWNVLTAAVFSLAKYMQWVSLVVFYSDSNPVECLQ